MKNIVVLKVQKLRIYPEAIERTSKVSKTKGMRVGAFIFGDNLPKSAGQSDSNVIEVSEKQLNNLCADCGIPFTGKQAWNVLQGYLLRGGHAFISAVEHSKGDKYVNSDGEEKEYNETSTSCSLDTVVLPETLVNKLQQSYIDKVLNYKQAEDEMKDFLKDMENKPEAVVDGVR
jgi:hypothetical protein